MRTHDLRAGFVTTALANARTETWVADRTGHKAHSMIKRYTRQADDLKARQLGSAGRRTPLEAAEVGHAAA